MCRAASPKGIYMHTMLSGIPLRGANNVRLRIRPAQGFGGEG